MPKWHNNAAAGHDDKKSEAQPNSNLSQTPTCVL